MLNLGAGGQIPDASRTVVAAARDVQGIRGYGDCADGAFVPNEASDFLPVILAQSRTMPSSLPVTIPLPSVVKATQRTLVE